MTFASLNGFFFRSRKVISIVSIDYEFLVDDNFPGMARVRAPVLFFSGALEFHRKFPPFLEKSRLFSSSRHRPYRLCYPLPANYI